jgi:hypothetical protein
VPFQFHKCADPFIYFTQHKPYLNHFMKKIFLLILLIVAIRPAFAQSVKFGISGGLNESILSLQNNTDNKNSRLAGFNAGIFSDINFGKFSVEPGLYYTTKGEKDISSVTDAMSGNSIYAKSQVSYNYLQLPVNILYNIHVGAGKFFVGGGPYLAYGLSGKSKSTTTYTYNGVATTNDANYTLTFGNTENNLNRLDFGLGALGGFQLNNGLSISAGYQHGLSNVENSSTNTVKNDVITVSLGYCFL